MFGIPINKYNYHLEQKTQKETRVRIKFEHLLINYQHIVVQVPGIRLFFCHPMVSYLHYLYPWSRLYHR